MFKIEDANKLKFTKIRYERINFKYDGVQYSLNLHRDGGDYVLVLWDRSNGNYIMTYDYESMDLSDYISISYNKTLNKPIIYSHIDKEHFKDKLNNFITGSGKE